VAVYWVGQAWQPFFSLRALSCARSHCSPLCRGESGGALLPRKNLPRSGRGETSVIRVPAIVRESPIQNHWTAVARK
jgi:hypothetical protein